MVEDSKDKPLFYFSSLSRQEKLFMLGELVYIVKESLGLASDFSSILGNSRMHDYAPGLISLRKYLSEQGSKGESFIGVGKTIRAVTDFLEHGQILVSSWYNNVIRVHFLEDKKAIILSFPFSQGADLNGKSASEVIALAGMSLHTLGVLPGKDIVASVAGKMAEDDDNPDTFNILKLDEGKERVFFIWQDSLWIGIWSERYTELKDMFVKVRKKLKLEPRKY